MMSFGPEWSHIHRKESFRLWSPFLTFPSALYGIGIRLRLWAYECGLFKRESLPGFVVSIGNITAGGTGKTPAVVMLARWARNEGHPVAVLSRGYGGTYKSKVLAVSDGNRIMAGPGEAGDEPYLLATRLSDIPVVVSKKRFLAGLFAYEKYGCDFFILDDGFQHLELHRDLNLALLDSTNPLGNGNLLPRGPLREPVEQLARANACVVTRCEGQGSGETVPGFLKVKFSSIPVFCTDHVPEHVFFPHLKEVYDPEFLKGKRVLAFAGIALPERFKKTLTGLGADVAYFRGFRDHYPFKKDDIRFLIQMKEKLGAEYIITTEKDWVRVSPLAADLPDMAYLSINFEFRSGRDEFFKMIKDKMAAKKARKKQKVKMRVIGNKKIGKNRVRRILVRATNWVGDAVMTLPALEALRENFPHSSITVLGKPWMLPLLENHPAVDNVIILKKKGRHLTDLFEVFRVVREIRKQEFDLAVLFQNAFEAALLAYLGGVGFRLGYNTDVRGFLLSHRIIRNDEVLKVHQVEYYLSILRAMGWKAASRDPSLYVEKKYLNEAWHIVDSNGIKKGDFLIGLSPGAIFGEAKRWPVERFARIGDWAAERWGARVLVMGSEKEMDICRGLSDFMKNRAVNLCGRTSLGEAMGVISLCRFFVTNDSGLMHMAAALNVPTVAVFGSTDPVATGPRGPNSRIVKHDIECAPCLKAVCPTDFRCMLSIEPEEVWDAMEALREDLG